MKQRLLCFGNSTIELRYGEGRPADLVRFLFQHVPETPVAEPWTRFHLQDAGGDSGWSLQRDDNFVYQNLPMGRMADHLMGQVCYTLAYESRQGLLLHAAAVRAAGKGIILPGKSGAGKSTLTAWLAANGCDYSTDEMVFIPNVSKVLHGFTRPIAIKAQARHLLTTLVKKRYDGRIIIQDPVEMLPATTLGAPIVEGNASLDLIVFPHYYDGKPLELRRLSKAQATFELMRCLANARNLDGHGLQEAVRLAEGIPAYSLTFPGLKEGGDAVASLLQ